MAKKRYVGIDLGTTNSTVSVAELNSNQQVQAKTIQIQQYEEHGMTFSEELPSVVHFDEDSIPYVGRYAKRMQSYYPKETLSNVKRHIGDKVEWEIRNDSYLPEHISSFILRKLKKTVEEKYFGEEIDSAVITVPASFDFHQQGKTKIAAELAGFNKEKIHMIPEPTASLIDFLHEENIKDNTSRVLDVSTGPKIVLVFDLGGGTCDVTIHRISQGENNRLSIQDLSISQYTELGGADFDSAVMKYLFAKRFREKGVSPREMMAKYSEKEFNKLREMLLDFAEKAKIDFSRRISAREQMQGICYYDQPELFDSLSFSLTLFDVPKELEGEITITKKELDELIRPLLYQNGDQDEKNIEFPIMNALRMGKIPLTVHDIDHIFLVGGMTAFPTVKHRVKEIFGKEPTVATNPMQSVSRGAAIYHYFLDEISIFPVEIDKLYPQNVYIKVHKSTPVPLITKDTTVPHSKTIDTGFFVSGSGEYVNTMSLELFSADDPKAMIQKQLKNATIEFDQPVRVGSPLVFHIDVDNDRNLQVKAWLKDDETQMVYVDLGITDSTEEEKALIGKRQEAMTNNEYKEV
ncbi:Hsp70 family protein [Cytobacillus sp. S13-E01]|uniref:Hsp70 family protein n=1 Tax=Cytobacillus sp. S13-E01 TaxID=3031326 RepID=UPI0023D83BD2|nr:Hsp70 family protein [Cytobacillus sp. S13-E01]MDF0728894.1 Hsp70 family protein [Cytobacillus sp. S13-E01]